MVNGKQDTMKRMSLVNIALFLWEKYIPSAYTELIARL